MTQKELDKIPDGTEVFHCFNYYIKIDNKEFNINSIQYGKLKLRAIHTGKMRYTYCGGDWTGEEEIIRYFIDRVNGQSFNELKEKAGYKPSPTDAQKHPEQYRKPKVEPICTLGRFDLIDGMKVNLQEGDKLFIGEISIRYGRWEVKLPESNYGIQLSWIKKRNRYQGSNGGTNGRYPNPIVVVSPVIEELQVV